MADLLFGRLGLMPGPVRRKARKFRLHDDFSLDEYTDEELRSRYRFGRESIELLIDLLRDDLERPPLETMPCQQLYSPCCVAVFCLRKLSASYWRYHWFVKVDRVSHHQQSFLCPRTKTSTLHQVAIERSRNCSN